MPRARSHLHSVGPLPLPHLLHCLVLLPTYVWTLPLWEPMLTCTPSLLVGVILSVSTGFNLTKNRKTLT